MLLCCSTSGIEEFSELLNVVFMLCLEVWMERRVEESKREESSGEESIEKWLPSTLFGCF